MSSLKLNGWAEMVAFGLTATFCSIMILGLFFAIWSTGTTRNRRPCSTVPTNSTNY